MRIKEIYENAFDDDPDNDFDLKNIDDSAFGFDLDSNNSIIGHFYIFLMTLYNLIEIKQDKTPIIDNKGQIQGYVKYGLNFEVFETYGDQIKDLLDYESLSDLQGKKIKIHFDILGAEGLPNQLCTKTHCQYEFYQTKDPNAKKIQDPSSPNPDGSTTAMDETTSEDEDDLDARMGDGNESSSVVKAPKRKRKLF